MKSESAAGRSSGNDDALRAEEDVMTVQELIDKQIFGVVNLGDSLDRQITVPLYCHGAGSGGLRLGDRHGQHEYTGGVCPDRYGLCHSGGRSGSG